ncbi:hypothetical protein [Microbaculum sp. FT89]|uniref:hypothetical protein n=1 Tax=Microbaculum sp. FT89 TaxID=3447298 RepID=UPI003F5360A3
MTEALDRVLDAVIARGDLAHLALFLWAGAASALSWHALRELARSNRRFEEFVTALARVDRLIRGRE